MKNIKNLTNKTTVLNKMMFFSQIYKYMNIKTRDVVIVIKSI